MKAYHTLLSEQLIIGPPKGALETYAALRCVLIRANCSYPGSWSQIHHNKVMYLHQQLTPRVHSQREPGIVTAISNVYTSVKGQISGAIRYR